MSNIITQETPICQKEDCNLPCMELKYGKEKYSKFCSRSHANTHNHSDETKKKIGGGLKRFYGSESNKRTVFSKSKGMRFYVKNSISRIYGVLPIPEDIKINKQRILNGFSHKFYKRVLSNYSCEHCGVSQWKGQRAYLEIDHIDGNKKNNALSNLRLLCVNCHSQTDTYKNKNDPKTINKNLLRTNIHHFEKKWLDRDFDSLHLWDKRRIVFYEQNFMCLHCGVSKWRFKYLRMDLDHIDGDKTNNKRENLRMLCPNCHAATDTFRTLNIKK